MISIIIIIITTPSTENLPSLCKSPLANTNNDYKNNNNDHDNNNNDVIVVVVVVVDKHNNKHKMSPLAETNAQRLLCTLGLQD